MGTFSSEDPFAAIARSLGNQHGELETVEKGLAVAVELIEGCHHAGVSMVRGDQRIETSAATSAVAMRGDELQYELREGPCLDAVKTQETILCPDLLHEPRWATWAPRVAQELGVRSMMCLQLFTTSRSFGALNLYSESVDAFDVQDQALGVALAAHVAVALASSREIDTREMAIISRTVIGQAEGILMERYDLTPDKAFAVLRRVSQDTQTKLVTVATNLVRTRRLPPRSPE